MVLGGSGGIANPAVSTDVGYLEYTSSLGHYGFNSPNILNLLNETNHTLNQALLYTIWQKIYMEVNQLAVAIPIVTAKNYFYQSSCLKSDTPLIARRGRDDQRLLRLHTDLDRTFRSPRPLVGRLQELHLTNTTDTKEDQEPAPYGAEEKSMEYKVISADDHLDIRFFPKDIFTSRGFPADAEGPGAARGRRPNNERYKPEDGMSDWVCGDKVMAPWGCYTAAQGSGAMWAIERGGSLRVDELRPTTPEYRLEDMDRDGIQASVMYGPPDPFFIDDPEIRRVTFRAYNDWLVEFCSYAPDRFIGVAQLDYEDPEFSADELARTAEAGLKHVNVLAARAKPAWYEPEWERFWSIAEETGIPVGSHLTVVQRRDRVAGEGGRNYGGAVFSLGQQLVEPYAGLILSGVLDRHPGVKVVMAESGIAFVPNMIQTLDVGWKRAHAGTAPATVGGCERPPVSHFRDNIWMTFQEDPGTASPMLPLLLRGPRHVGVGLPAPREHVAELWPRGHRVTDEGVVRRDHGSQAAGRERRSSAATACRTRSGSRRSATTC